jgi:hypothetical protein
MGPTQYAIEHTLVQAYPEQIQDGVQFVDALEALETQLSPDLPKTAWFMLTVPSHAFKKLSRRKADQIGTSIAKWVLAFAPLLDLGARFDRRTDTPPGVPFPVTLQSVTGIPALHGKLRIARYTPPDLENLRFQQLAASLDKKLPKLHVWAQSGARTVLVLEDNDIALTNHVVVSETLRQALATRQLWPDYVVFVMSCMAQFWFASTILEDREFPALSRGGWDYVAFSPADLQDITNT